MSIVIPVKDAGADLRPLLQRIREQQGFRAVEAVVVDSGSTDGSAELAESMGATVVRIAPSEFSHSYARNLAAERATGDYVLFTVQDALPTSELWLREMYDGLRRHRAAAVTCGEEPRPDADLFYRAISWNHNRFMSPDGADVVMEGRTTDDPTQRRRNAQLSDTACLIGRSLFLRYRHRGEYAEDLDLGLRLSADGYRLVFLASPRIVHSHNRPAYYHLRRSYVEHLTLFQLLPGYPAASGGAHEAAAEAVRSFAAASSIAGGVLGLVPPCDLETVRRQVSCVSGNGLPAGPAAGPITQAVDERTRAFVERLSAESAGDALSTGVSLAAAVGGMGALICDYLDSASLALLDAPMLGELEAALYKAWALHCGVYLASVYWKGSDGDRAALRAIHEELTREV